MSENIYKSKDLLFNENNIESKIIFLNNLKKKTPSYKKTYNIMVKDSEKLLNENKDSNKNPLKPSSKKLKTVNDANKLESSIKESKPKIPERILKEIRKYQEQERLYNYSCNYCQCDDCTNIP